MPLPIFVVCSSSQSLESVSSTVGFNYFILQFFFSFGFSINSNFIRHEASIFGQLWRLEPLPAEKKSMWRREMEWLICVSDHIVELIPSWQTFPDGKKLEVILPTVLILLRIVIIKHQIYCFIYPVC